MMNKSDIRNNIKIAKRGIPNCEKSTVAETITNYIEEIKEFKECKSILLYNSLPDEVSTSEMIKRWQETKRLCLPTTLSSGDLEIREFNSATKLQRGAYGIYESQGDLVDISEIELIIVPGVAFDRENNRLGRGKGYYDKLLKGSNAYKIGVAYSLQIVDCIPTEQHDIKMDLIITEKGNL